MVENQEISLNSTQVVGIMLNGQPVPALVLKNKDGHNAFLSGEGIFNDRNIAIQLIFPNFEDEFLPISYRDMQLVQMRLKGMH